MFQQLITPAIALVVGIALGVWLDHIFYAPPPIEPNARFYVEVLSEQEAMNYVATHPSDEDPPP